MPGRVLYKVRHKDTSGNWVATYTHWRRLSYTKRLNRAGGVELNLGYNETIENNLALDSLLEVWRKYPDGTWYEEFSTLHRNVHRRVEADGRDVMTSYARGLLDLIARRVILGYAGTSYTDKSGQAETVLKELVGEQAVAGAIYREIAGLTVEADSAGGNSIEFARAYKNLGEVIEEFAGDVGGGDVGIETNGAAQWIFRWYDGQLGGDKTWGNGAGNPPVVFSLGFGNMRLPEYGFVRTDEINSVYVGGQGTGINRLLENRTDATAIAASPMNRIEVFRSSNSDVSTELQDIGDAALQDLQARRTFRMSVIQTDSTRYGDHYTLGDKVTVRFGNNVELDRRIVGVSVTVDRNGEDVKLEMDDVP